MPLKTGFTVPDTYKPGMKDITVFELSSIVLTKLQDSALQGLTVSVLPSRNNLVILDS